MDTTIPNWVFYLVEAGRCAPSADNSQPWRFCFDGHSLFLKFDESRGSGLGREHPATLLAFGGVIENVMQAALWVGMDLSEWEFPEVGAGQPCFLKVPAPMKDLATLEIPSCILERHTNRGTFLRTPLADNIVTRITQDTQDGVHALVFCDRSAISALAKLVRHASELRFQTEEIHRWLAGSLRFSESEIERGDGLDINTLDLPPGGKLLSKFLGDWSRMAFLNHFGAYKLLAWVEVSKLNKAECAIVIVGKGQGSDSWVSAGRLMERLWIALNDNNVAVHPYFVLPDQLYRLQSNRISSGLRLQAENLAIEAQELFGPSKTLFMVLRVGSAETRARRSKRLPTKTVLTLG